MSDRNIYPPKLERAVYAEGPMDHDAIVFEFSGGYAARYFIGEKFPRPGAPVIPLFEVEGVPMPKTRFSGTLPIDDGYRKFEWDDFTDDPVLVNLALEMVHNSRAGRFRAGTQVWPPPA